MAEDYQGHEWMTVHRSLHGLTYVRPCTHAECLFGVTIQQDVLGHWYARHQYPADQDWRTTTGRTRSTWTSRRHHHWQDAATEAHDSGITSLR